MVSRSKSHSAKRTPGTLWGLALAASLLVSGTALALPPEHEIQRLMLAVEESVESGRWRDAAEYLNRLQRLEGQKPAQYLYYRGQVMARSEHYNEAMSALENYVAGTGADGKYYTESLKLITTIEQARSSQASGRGSGEAGQEPVAEIARANEPGQSGGSVADSDASRQSLVSRMNRIFDRAGWRRDPRLIREGSTPDVHYQASVHNGEIQFRESRNEKDGGRRLTTLMLPVYGVSPMIEWSCESATESCWIYDPRDGTRFLRLGNDRDQADVLADTLGSLIRTMQAPDGDS